MILAVLCPLMLHGCLETVSGPLTHKNQTAAPPGLTGLSNMGLFLQGHSVPLSWASQRCRAPGAVPCCGAPHMEPTPVTSDSPRLPFPPVLTQHPLLHSSPHLGSSKAGSPWLTGSATNRTCQGRILSSQLSLKLQISI